MYLCRKLSLRWISYASGFDDVIIDNIIGLFIKYLRAKRRDNMTNKYNIYRYGK